LAIVSITVITWPISAPLRPRADTVTSVVSTACTAAATTWAASAASPAISCIRTPISSLATTSRWTFSLTSLLTCRTEPAWHAVSSALALIWWLTAVSDVDE
jgi:hypothetical protein